MDPSKPRRTLHLSMLRRMTFEIQDSQWTNMIYWRNDACRLLARRSKNWWEIRDNKLMHKLLKVVGAEIKLAEYKIHFKS
jgi:hypothetical protein